MNNAQTPLRTVHVAPLHRRDDVRIFLKECAALAEAGYDVSLVVADGQGDETTRGIKVLDTGLPPAGKFAKRLVPLLRSARTAHKLRPDVIHFHDGMFLPFAIWLTLLGRRVIYDVHEDYPEQVLNLRFPAIFRQVARFGYIALEWVGSRRFSAIVAATPAIAAKFPSDSTATIQNFPICDEYISLQVGAHGSRPKHFAYVGGLTVIRGLREMVGAVEKMRNSGGVLELGGSFSPLSLEAEVQTLPGWPKVRYHGWLSRKEAALTLGSCRAGLVLFYPAPNHLEAQPNKLFEYMAAGLPVIASDFPLWRSIIEKERCGLLVDPLDPQAIADAMDWILDNPEEAQAMGERAREAVLRTYNWDVEAIKLIECYRSLQTH